MLIGLIVIWVRSVGGITTFCGFVDHGVMLHGRILVDARQRRTINDRIWRGVLRAINYEPAVEFAYPTNRTILSREAQHVVAGEPLDDHGNPPQGN
ncbi:MAG: hypothetical protein HKN91_10750 [Acidimicrobiia bacterium]|nr:hypothetical protein [Acidimicrobiia bacterium]